MRILKLIILVTIAIFVFGCEEKAFNPAAPKGPDFSLTPMENEEAELAAIYLSGKIIAPVPLYVQFQNEVALIRNTWEDSIYHTDIRFKTNFLVSEILIITSWAVYDSMKLGNYHHWDSLNSYYRFDSILFRYDFSPIVSIYFKGRLNPNIISKEYSGLPGIQSAEPNRWVTEFPVILPIEFGNTIKYFFNYAHEDCFDGCDYFDVFYYTVSNDSAYYHGSYSFNVWEIPPPEPSWFDTARIAYQEYHSINSLTQKRTSLWHSFGTADSIKSNRR
jgi:hypothetical protein